MQSKENPAPEATGSGAGIGYAKQLPSTRNSATNQDFAPQSSQPRMRLVSFKPMIKGALRGFANVSLPTGLNVTDCPVCVSHGKAWASLPSKPVLDRDGKHVEVNGKRQYAAMLSWADRPTADRWSEAVVALVRQAHPEALS